MRYLAVKFILAFAATMGGIALGIAVISHLPLTGQDQAMIAVLCAAWTALCAVLGAFCWQWCSDG